MYAENGEMWGVGKENIDYLSAVVKFDFALRP